MAKLYRNLSVKITDEEFKKITEFAEKTWSTHKPGKRTKEQIIHHIILGKIGELGYCKMNKKLGIPISEFSLEEFDGDDGGHDLELHKKTIDVKSIEEKDRNYKRQITGISLRADAYVLCWVDKENRKITYEGAITRMEIINRRLLETDRDKNYSFVLIKYLKELNEFFE